jgi:hypothetical protein
MLVFSWPIQIVRNASSAGYTAPILHLRRMEGGDFFDLYIQSFERVWEVSSPIQESNFWRQRPTAISSATPNDQARLSLKSS